MVKFVKTINEFKECVSCEKPTIVDFTASWCGPCQHIAPVFERLAKEHGDTITCIKVDVDELEDVVTECGIEAMPTFLVFKKGVKLDLAVQGADKDALSKLFEDASKL